MGEKQFTSIATMELCTLFMIDVFTTHSERSLFIAFQMSIPRIKGSFSVNREGSGRTIGLTISCGGSVNNLFGGSIAGPLIAAGTMQVILLMHTKEDVSEQEAVKCVAANLETRMPFINNTPSRNASLRCIEAGSDLSKTVAAFIMSKILTQEQEQLHVAPLQNIFMPWRPSCLNSSRSFLEGLQQLLTSRACQKFPDIKRL